MVYLLNPLVNPLGFLFLKIMTAMNYIQLWDLFTSAILVSLLIYPFVLLGIKMSKNKTKKQKRRPLMTTIIVLFIFFIVSRLYYIIVSAITGAGFSFFGADFVTMLIGLFLILLGTYPGVLFSLWLDRIIKKKYTIPFYLNVYLIGLITSIVYSIIGTVMIQMVRLF